MRKLLFSLVLVLLLAIVIFVALVATRSEQSTSVPVASFPDSTSVPLERPTVSNASTSDTGQSQDTGETRHLSSPGSIAVESPQDKRMIQELLQSAQTVPNESGSSGYILQLGEHYDITLNPSDAHKWVVSVTLKHDPIHYYRMLAEADVAHRIQVEREDICGVPFDIHTLPDHPASALGNLGLQHCGADKLANTEWENYDYPSDN